MPEAQFGLQRQRESVSDEYGELLTAIAEVLEDKASNLAWLDDVCLLVDGYLDGGDPREGFFEDLEKDLATAKKELVGDEGEPVDFEVAWRRWVAGELDDAEGPEAEETEIDEDGEDEWVPDMNAVSAGDPVEIYFRQMAQEQLLTAQEEIDLAKRIEAGKKAELILKDSGGLSVAKQADNEEIVGDAQKAREHLGRANTRLVVSIAKRYIGQGLPFPDLIQEGNVGLMRAVDKFDYTRGNRFSTYATWWIRQGITRALADQSRTIRLPVGIVDEWRKMYKVDRMLEQKLRRKPTEEELAKEMGTSVKRVQGLIGAGRLPLELDAPLVGETGRDGDMLFGEAIEDKDSPQPAEVAVSRLLVEEVDEVLNKLTPRQAHILRLRFGLGGREQHTLEEIANKFGLSRERIRQIEKEVLRRLRYSRIAHNLRDSLR